MREGWKEIILKEACDLFTDGDWIETKNQSPEGIRLIQTGNIGSGNFKNRKNKARYISEDTFEDLNCTEVFPGDLLVSRLPDPVGRSCLIPDIDSKMITAVDCTIIRPKQDLLDPKYLMYFQMSRGYYSDVYSSVTGTTRSRISRKNLGRINIPIPPLPEQKRIVEILDEAFEAIDQARANVERNIQNAEELFQSKLNEIFSQRGEGWVSNKLKDITTKIGSGATPRGGKKNYKESGISLIRSMNVYDRGFEKEKLAFIDETQAEKLSNVELENGDVILNITGASVARCCIVPEEFLPARVNQHVSIIRLAENTMDERFLHYALLSKPYKDHLLGIGEQGATRQAITKAQIQDFSISYPTDIEKQREIIETIDEYKDVSNSLSTTYKTKFESLDELKKSILQKAFSGELTANEHVAV